MVRHIASRTWDWVGRASQRHRPMSPAHATVWKELKGKKLLGCRFERQHAIDHYVVDFYCGELGLAVEVEVPNRDNPEACEYARQRDVRLRLCGIAVLRFTDDEVIHNLDGVLAKIRQSICCLPWRKARW